MLIPFLHASPSRKTSYPIRCTGYKCLASGSDCTFRPLHLSLLPLHASRQYTLRKESPYGRRTTPCPHDVFAGTRAEIPVLGHGFWQACTALGFCAHPRGNRVPVL